MTTAWKRRIAAAILLVLASAAKPGNAAENETGDSRLGDGSGSIMTFSDLDDVAPHREAARPAVPHAAVPASPRVPPYPAPRSYDYSRPTHFQERFPGRLPARIDSLDGLERREARREFFRNNASGGRTRLPGIPRPRLR